MYKIMLGNDEIFNPTRMSNLPVQEARQSEQLNEPGALQFTLIHGHPKYGLLEGMAAYITAYDDDDIIFYGRVITDGLPTFSGQITYDCEGALSFLNDSEVTPSKNPISKTPQQLFEWCIQQHNTDIGNDPRRTFTAGNVTVSEKNKSEQFQITSYTKTKDVIDNQLINVYGGYLKVRYDNGVRYLDWLEHYSDNVNPQTILIGENVIDRAFSNSGEGLFTVIRPVGKNGLLLDTQTIDVFSQEMITKYGRIVKTISFSDASTKAALQTKAEEYVARVKKTLLCTGSIKMVDMHYIDGTSPKVQLGDRFTNIEGLNGVEMTISALERDFMHEYEDSCEFGNDKSLREDSVRAGGSISKSSSRAGGAAGMNFKHIMELEDTIEINSETLYQHGQTLIQHYNSIEQQGNQITSLSTTSETLVDLVSEQGERITTVEGTGVIQNDELLSTFAGTMRIVRDQSGTITGLQFVDGTMVMDTAESGHMVTVGAAIAAAKNGVETIQGSALWNQRDNITGVAGEFEIVTDAQGNKTVVIKSGGGMKIRRDNVEYGLYDSGNLTGGIIVDKINDGTTTTKIKGTRVILGENLSDDDLNTWAENARAGTGVFAKYLTVRNLSAQEISTLLANIDDADIGSLSISEGIEIGTDGYLVVGGDVTAQSIGAVSIDCDEMTSGDEPVLLIRSITKSQDGKTLTITPVDGDPITFEKAAGGTIVGPTWLNTPSSNPGSNSNTATFSIEGASGSGSEGSVQLYLSRSDNWENNVRTIYMSHTDTGTPGNRIAKITVDASTLVSNATTAGKNSAKVTGPTWATNPSSSITGNSNTATFTTDADSPVSGAAKSLSLYMTQGSWSSNKKYVYVHHTNSSEANRIARYEVDASTLVSNATTAGKNSAKVTGPTWATNPSSSITGNSNTATFTTDADSPVSGAAKSLSLYMTQGSWSSNKKYVYVHHTNSSEANRIARYEVDASSIYTNGQNSVGINTPTWSTTPASGITASGNTATFKTDAPTQSSRSLAIYLSKDNSFSSHKLYAYASHTNNTAANRIARIEIDATSEYNAGFNASHGIWLFEHSEPSNDVLPLSGNSHKYGIRYNTTSGTAFIDHSWEVPGVWLEYSSGTADQGTLGADSIIALTQYNSDGTKKVLGKWQTPSGGSSYSHSATLYCYEITTGSTGVKTVRFSVQYSASQSVPFSTGRQYSMHW